MYARLLHRAPGSPVAAWFVRFRGVQHRVLAPTAIDAWTIVLDTYEIEA